VESVPLITASILSKKLAAGLQGLVLDVKCGSGAFAAHPGRGARAGPQPGGVATGAGLPARALITDMDQVLGHTAGNALEVQEAIDFLTGAVREPRLLEVTLALGEQMLHLGGLAPTLPDGRAALQRALDSGAAAERFARMVAAAGRPGRRAASRRAAAGAGAATCRAAGRAGWRTWTCAHWAWPWWRWAAAAPYRADPSTPCRPVPGAAAGCHRAGGAAAGPRACGRRRGRRGRRGCRAAGLRDRRHRPHAHAVGAVRLHRAGKRRPATYQA
jgi:hypothetical protein